MATTKKMEQDMAFFGGKVPSTVTRKKMDGDDKKDGWRRKRRWNKTWHFLGEECHQRCQERRWMATTKKMDGNDKEDGWQRQRRWMATTEKMEQDMAFFGGRMLSMVTKKMDGNDKEDGWQRQRRWMATTKKMDGNDKEDG